jgi:hypothetical protein
MSLLSVLTAPPLAVPTPVRIRFERVAILTVIGVAMVAITAQLVAGFALLNWGGTDWGGDLRDYLDATRSWLQGDGFYLPRQLHGPYATQLGDVLYPPTALFVLIPFLVLPAPVWWVLAVGLPAFLIWSWRPRPWAVALILVCLAFPNMAIVYFRGAPVIVITAVIAAALRWKWPGALLLLKPSILPFALIGIRTRGWWLTAGLLVVLTLPVLPLVPAWVQATMDSRGNGGWLYSLKDLPLMMVPVVAYLGRTRDPESWLVPDIRQRLTRRQPVAALTP